MNLPATVSRVAVLGAGTIGSSWTAWFLSRGLSVAVWDPRPEAEAFVRDYVARAWPQLARLGMAAGADPGGWRWAASPEDAVRDAQFVQENAPEQLDAKRELYARIDKALPPDAVVASSTSGLLASDIQAGMGAAARIAVGHPFNPPHLIPLVEVVGGRETAPETVAWCLDFYNRIGKRAIHIRKEARGHLANRLQAALWREAVHAVASGLASVEDVDAAIAYGPGLRWAAMGPHMTFHLGGGAGGIAHFLPQFRGPMEEWWATLGQPALTDDICAMLADGIAAEAKGRTIPDLAAERDAMLLPLLEMKAKRG